MALKSDVIRACRSEGSEKPIDLVYLSSLTMGDRQLEAEILSMFAVQLPQYVSLLEKSPPGVERERAAHTLKGAARSVGAFHLAELAAGVESTGEIDQQAMVRATASVCRYIDEISTNS